MNLIELRYPIGKFKLPAKISAADRAEYLLRVERLPEQMKEAVANLSDAQLDTPYRPDGWTVRQVVHHVADSHLNSYIRFKWALTESQPLIKAYDEKQWAQLKDASEGPVSMSLALLDSIHIRWVWLMKNLHENDWKKCFTHPETGKLVPLDLNLSLYSWHGNHHLAQIHQLIEREGWVQNN
jgi:hypothetical protein